MSLAIEQRHAKNFETFSKIEHKMLDNGFGLMHWVRGKNGNANYYLYFKNGDNTVSSFSANQDASIFRQGIKENSTRAIYLPDIKSQLNIPDEGILDEEQVSALCKHISQSYKEKHAIVSYNFTDTLGNNGIFSQSIKSGIFNLSELPKEATALALISVSDGLDQTNIESTILTGKQTPKKIEQKLLSISKSIYDDKSIAIVPITRRETIFHGDGHGIFRGTKEDITICVSAHLNDIKSQMPEVPSAILLQN